MDAQTIVALIGFFGTVVTLGVGIFSSVRAYKQSEESKRKERREQEALSYLKEQLAFYSSIQALLEANKAVFNLPYIAGKAMERSDLNEEEQIIADTVIIPNNEKIVSKIIGSPHLIEGGAIPDSYGQFLAHAFVWKAFHDFSKKKIHFEYEPNSLRFPQSFGEDIVKQMRVIKERYYNFIKQRESAEEEKERQKGA